jgi:hypothetical protein
MSGASPKPPPLPTGRDRRAAPRYEVLAQASVKSDDEVYVLVVRNLSSCGAFFEAKPWEHPRLTIGTEVEIVLTCGDPQGREEDLVNIRCVGHIAHIDPGVPPVRPSGFGLALRPVDNQASDQLERVIASVAARAAPLP